MSKSRGVFQFSGGRVTSRRQCPRGGACGMSSPPLQETVICVKFRANQPLCPPPNQSVPIRLCLTCTVPLIRLSCLLVSILSHRYPAGAGLMGVAACERYKVVCVCSLGGVEILSATSPLLPHCRTFLGVLARRLAI